MRRPYEYGPKGPAVLNRPELYRLAGNTEPLTFFDVLHAELVDETGVPMNSDRSYLAVAGSIDWEYGDCPYQDSPSRFPATQTEQPPKPMSFFERQRLHESYREILGITQFMRRNFFDATTDDKSLDYGQTTILLTCLKFLPHFLALRSQDNLPYDSLPVSLAALHNVATGTLAGIHAEFEAKGKGDQNYVPDIEAVIQAVETRDDKLVGDKTVCVASPNMMRSFYGAAIHGHGLNSALVPDWLLQRFDVEQIEKLAIFSQTMEKCENPFRFFVQADSSMAYHISHPEADPNEGEPTVDQLVSGWFKAGRGLLGEFRYLSRTINYSLGRRTAVPDVSLEDITYLKLPLLADGSGAEQT